MTMWRRYAAILLVATAGSLGATPAGAQHSTAPIDATSGHAPPLESATSDSEESEVAPTPGEHTAAEERPGADSSAEVGAGAAQDGAPLCVSVGAANNGWLIGGVPLDADARLQTREGRNFGTVETIEGIREAVERVHKRFPRHTHRLVVGDISRRSGGRLRPHRSHQSGRDADIGYFHKDKPAPRWFRKARASTIDLPRTWTFIEGLLADGKVEYLFIDYALQGLLYNYALKKRKMSKGKLSRLFAYPRGRRARVGIIRHSSGHRDHMHVRFHSPDAVAAVTAYIARHGEDAIEPVPVHATVKSGQTLTSIARRHRTTVKKIRAWNGLERGKLLHPGDRLVVGWERPALPQ